MRIHTIGLLLGLGGAIATSGAVQAEGGNGSVSFRNDVSKAYELVEARFVIDGQAVETVLTRPEAGKEYVVVAGPLPPGRHVVSSELQYQGKNRSVFNYMDGYKFNVRAEEVLTIPEDGTASFTIVGNQKKGLNVPPAAQLGVVVEEERRPEGANTAATEPPVTP